MSPGLDHTFEQDREITIAGDRGVNPCFAVKNRSPLKQIQITISGDALLCSAVEVPCAAPYHEESCRGLTVTALP